MAELVGAAIDRLMPLHGGARGCVVARRDGSIVAERYAAGWGPDDKAITYSVTKTVMQLLYLIAKGKGQVGDATPLRAVFTDHPWDEEDEAKKALTLGHLVRMTDGLDGGRKYSLVEPMAESDDPVALALRLPLAHPVGAHFRYDNVPSDLLAMALQRAVGTSLLQYAEQHLFAPLGIAGAWWRPMAAGGNMGGSGVFLGLRDMAKLGVLIHQDGAFQGRQIIPAVAVAEWKDEVRAGTFAHLWAEPGRGLYASGIHGQGVLIAEGYVAAFQGTEVGEHHEDPAHDKTRAFREAAWGILDIAREEAA
eukprot:TRINITY_DN22533_c0_g1_i1.p2 TRINITY_DN22533_c0_g1~~TRINITY_DN22533_c0_g1_i1.p2  ORF type:complete len:358 (+),score=111.90 TRINITY_DN22533_c0_g1_i1:156-1076(+)